MRQYLFELRKKANKTQKEIDCYVLEKYGFKMQYIGVELGRLWKNLSGNRAVMLADALGTTPEYILKCEAEQGGYDRYSANSGYATFHNIKYRAEYNEPFTDEEKALIEEYLPYAEKVIDKLKYGRYKSCLDTLMTSADFYDVGLLAFLRTVKSLTCKRRDAPEYFDTIDEIVPFYRFNFSRSIEGTYIKYIRGAKTAKRKASINSLSLDSEIRDGESDETFYNFIPSKDLPIPIKAESSWNLDMLYSYLNKKQIRVCKMLISGWTKSEVITHGYASLRDIGIIKFYLEQFNVHGKILWRAEDYKSETPNIHFCFTTLRWKFNVSYKTKTYSMGTYKDLCDALDVQLIAHSHILAGDFPQWHANHLTLNAAKVKVFTYPLPCDPEVDFSALPSLSERPKNNKKITRATKENPVGIYLNDKGTYDVQMGLKYKLGSCKTLTEALRLRRLAEDHYLIGDIDSWYAEFKYQKEKESITYARLEAKRSNDKGVSYAVVRSCDGKIMRLGRYPYEKAIEVKNLADSHIDAGDFKEWAEAFYADYLKESSLKPTYARMDKTVVNGIAKYIVRGSYLNNPYRLGTYLYEEEAVKVKALADRHIDEGDFLEWSKKFKEAYKKSSPHKFNTKVVYARIDKSVKHGKTIYEVVRTYEGKRFRLGTYASYDEAEKIKSIADGHIDAGDFNVWAVKFYADYQAETKARRYGKLRKSKKSEGSIPTYAAVYVVCKYTPENYLLLCFDANGTEHKIGETSDVEEAYKTMDLANEHIEAGDFDVWLADYKNIKTEVSQ